MKETPPPDECAICGAAIPRGARACPECGADERTGWRAQSIYDDLDLPAEAFEDELSRDGAKRGATTSRLNGIPWYWWCVGVALILLLTLGWIGFR